MKILFVFNHPAPYKVRLFNELAKEIDLDVIFERESASDRPDDFYNIKDYQFNCIFLKKGAYGAEESNTNELREYLKEHHHEYDLIIMNGYSHKTERKAISYVRKHKIPFVLYINGGVIRKENFLKRFYKKKLILSASKYMSPCMEASEYLLHYGVNPNNIYHYPYSTLYNKDIPSHELTEEERLKIRKEYNLPNNKLFITASQFIDRKNLIEVIDCFKGLDASLLIVGEGPEKESYLEFIKENSIHNVLIHKFMKRDELFNLMKACDGFITLSKEDIYGHTINEALGMGLPVVSSNQVISARHLLKNGENGYIVHLGQKEEIQSAINKVDSSMFQRAIETAKHNTFEESAKRHIEIFKELIK